MGTHLVEKIARTSPPASQAGRNSSAAYQPAAHRHLPRHPLRERAASPRPGDRQLRRHVPHERRLKRDAPAQAPHGGSRFPRRNRGVQSKLAREVHPPRRSAACPGRHRGGHPHQGHLRTGASRPPGRRQPRPDPVPRRSLAERRRRHPRVVRHGQQHHRKQTRPRAGTRKRTPAPRGHRRRGHQPRSQLDRHLLKRKRRTPSRPERRSARPQLLGGLPRHDLRGIPLRRVLYPRHERRSPG